MGRHYQQKYLNKSINKYIKLLNKKIIYIIYINYKLKCLYKFIFIEYILVIDKNMYSKIVRKTIITFLKNKNGKN